jgi:ribosomal protein S18 acetylase RimI-like enzyme
MGELALRQMTNAEFAGFRAWVISERAEVKASAGDWDADEALELASAEVDKLLPTGVDTPAMLLLTAQAPDGEMLGMVWIGFDRPDPRGTAWIYYIKIEPKYRRKGYGGALLRHAEELAVRHGARSVGLNVFWSNTVARGLYGSSSYKIISMLMRKAQLM